MIRRQFMQRTAALWGLTFAALRESPDPWRRMELALWLEVPSAGAAVPREVAR